MDKKSQSAKIEAEKYEEKAKDLKNRTNKANQNLVKGLQELRKSKQLQKDDDQKNPSGSSKKQSKIVWFFKIVGSGLWSVVTFFPRKLLAVFIYYFK